MDESRTNDEDTPENIDVEKERGVLSHSVEHTPEKIDIEREKGVLSHSVEHTPEKIDVEKERGRLVHSVEHTPEKIDVEKHKGPSSHSVEHASEKIEGEKGKGPLPRSFEHTPEKIEDVKEKDPSSSSVEHTPEKIEDKKGNGPPSHSDEHTQEKIEDVKEKGPSSHSVEHTPDKIEDEKVELSRSFDHTPENIKNEKGALSHSGVHAPKKIEDEKEKDSLSCSVEHKAEKIESWKEKDPLLHLVEHVPEGIKDEKEKGPLLHLVEHVPEEIEDEKEKGSSFLSLEHPPERIEDGKEEDLLHSIDLMTQEKIEDEKEKGPQYHCELCDAEIVHRIALEFLPGLGSACVDNTTGDLFNRPATVAVNIRKEMVEYLTQRSENFIAESVILETDPDGEVSDSPYDIISDFVDDFASSKRNFFSRVSGWLLSEKREDNIDDFVQEMELTGFWQIDRREVIAQNVLKNVDLKNLYHCTMNFNTQEELDEHIQQCGFRTMSCPNEGCDTSFSTSQLENHDLLCPFKMLPCEQMCGNSILRREMDRHCITICPMKLTNCLFYQIGCQSVIPQCKTEQHLVDDLHPHLLYVLQLIHKEVPREDLTKRAEQVLQASSPNQLASAQSVRSLLLRVRDIEAKLGPAEINTTKFAMENNAETTDTVAEIPVETETRI